MRACRACNFHEIPLALDQAFNESLYMRLHVFDGVEGTRSCSGVCRKSAAGRMPRSTCGLGENRLTVDKLERWMHGFRG